MIHLCDAYLFQCVGLCVECWICELIWVIGISLDRLFPKVINIFPFKYIILTNLFLFSYHIQLGDHVLLLICLQFWCTKENPWSCDTLILTVFTYIFSPYVYYFFFHNRHMLFLVSIWYWRRTGSFSWIGWRILVGPIPNKLGTAISASVTGVESSCKLLSSYK